MTGKFLDRVILFILPFALMLSCICAVLYDVDIFSVSSLGTPDIRPPDFAEFGGMSPVPFEKNGVGYDSFVIGDENIRSLSEEGLEACFGGSFRAVEIGGDNAERIFATAEYISENYTVKNLVILLGYGEAEDTVLADESAVIPDDIKKDSLSRFCARHTLSSGGDLKAVLASEALSQPGGLFLKKCAGFKDCARDCEYLGGEKSYITSHSDFSHNTRSGVIITASKVTENLLRLKTLCEGRGIALSLILSPEYSAKTAELSPDSLAAYKTALASVCDYYDFSGYSPVSDEARYFYDSRRFRPCVGDMMLAKISGDSSVYVPADFGFDVTCENVASVVATTVYSDSLAKTGTGEQRLPVLMYHSFVPEGAPTIATQITPSVFEAQMKALSDAGYTSVTTEQLVAYCERGEPLPEKSVMITIDDGYLDNIQRACPILKKYGMHAMISVIGITVGEREFYKDSGIRIDPYFSASEASPYIADRTIEIQSHSFDMHDVKNVDPDFRPGVLQKKGENEQEYIDAFRADCDAGFALVKNDFFSNCLAFAYPYGFSSVLSEMLLAEMGVEVTFTTKAGNNNIIKGHPQSLRGLNRYNITNNMSGRALLATIR